MTPDVGDLGRLPAHGELLKELGRLLIGLPSTRELDWSKVAHIARRHALAPLLFWRLRELEAEQGSRFCVPDEVMESLQADFYVSGARHLLAERHSAGVLRALDEAQIPALVLKGATIGEFYPDPATRMYGDLDLLVPRSLLDQAEQVITDLGYSAKYEKAWWLGHMHHLPTMVTQYDSFAVELHWRLDDEDGVGRLPVGELWDRAVPWQVGGQPGLRLNQIDSVLHLCRHAAVQHRAQQGLRPLCDLAHVTAHWGASEWNALAERAISLGLSRPVYLMMILAEELFDPIAPAEAINALEPSGGMGVPPGVVGSLLWPEGGGSVSVPRAVVQARARGGLSVGVRHLLWHLFLPREGMAVVYGIPADSPRIWLSYLMRPFDLLKRYGRDAWLALRGRRAAVSAWQREMWLENWFRGEEWPGG